ncbi:hypothetical protein L2E82_08049 [Cichorium intybus]|uniref:Uncharacterized protein n=1 Tax=Cichorium intybus TaxID=13427 RepID=A0ACB9G6E8_CICIN|nr:hypothetical protein L2E82_08049 [Cichorium intybus]
MRTSSFPVILPSQLQDQFASPPSWSTRTNIPDHTGISPEASLFLGIEPAFIQIELQFELQDRVTGSSCRFDLDEHFIQIELQVRLFQVTVPISTSDVQ